MSRLLGPLSEIMRSVSWRDCALAVDHTAGADGRTLPAASAVADFRNSRRFIIISNRVRISPQHSANRVPTGNTARFAASRGFSAVFLVVLAPGAALGVTLAP